MSNSMMVDWQSTKEIEKDAVAFNYCMHVLIGLYSWEFVCSFNFDWNIITAKKFNWNLAFYFATRYSVFLLLTGIILALDVMSPIDCQMLWTITELISSAAMGFACISFGLQIVALWDGAKLISIPLLFISLGQWSLILQPGIAKASYLPNSGCTIIEVNLTLRAATFIYALIFEFILFILTAIKLPKLACPGSTLLSRLAHHHSLLYIFLSLLFSCLATAILCLNLNHVMVETFVIPSITFTAIMASRCIRRAQKSTISDTCVFDQTSMVCFRKELYANHMLNSLPKTKTDNVHIDISMESVVSRDVLSRHSVSSDDESQVLPSE